MLVVSVRFIANDSTCKVFKFCASATSSAMVEALQRLLECEECCTLYGLMTQRETSDRDVTRLQMKALDGTCPRGYRRPGSCVRAV
jgi:hypothetical protein